MGQMDDKYLDLLRARYRRASKKERSAILDEYVKTTGCHRKYAIGVLRGKRKNAKHPVRRPRRAIYGDAEARALLARPEGAGGAVLAIGEILAFLVRAPQDHRRQRDRARAVAGEELDDLSLDVWLRHHIRAEPAFEGKDLFVRPPQDRDGELRHRLVVRAVGRDGREREAQRRRLGLPTVMSSFRPQRLPSKGAWTASTSPLAPTRVIIAIRGSSRKKPVLRPLVSWLAARSS